MVCSVSYERNPPIGLPGSGSSGYAALRAGGGSNDGVTYQAVPVSADTQDQFTFRFDHHINQRQKLSFYYYFTNDTNFQPYPDFQASGANIPGFGADVGFRYQQFNPSHTWTITEFA